MYIKIKAIRITQPLSDFFVFTMKAKHLLDLCFTDPIRYKADGELTGSQRKLDEERRLKSITKYVNSKDLALPNSIVIAANYNEEGFVEENETLRWKFEKIDEELYEISIPENKRLASVIDGQHRLFSFREASLERLETDLLVSAYFDLPLPLQAFIFATINYNQKPVSKSYAMEQFGYYLETNKPETWTPELLGVFFSRKMNLDQDSIFFNRIKVAPQDSQNLLTLDQKELDWKISMSTSVFGIIKLFTNNAKRDADTMGFYDFELRRRMLLKKINDKSVLREYYLEGNDVLIYTIINNFFIAVSEQLIKPSSSTSFIKKTTGISALFKLLEFLLKEYLSLKDIRVDLFREKIAPLTEIDFSDTFFQVPSSSGTSKIYNTMLVKLGHKDILSIINEEDRINISKLTKKN
ncbi:MULTISPECIES: DGQHR domain-containing protein [Sphingobacterium]|uniref:DGQHR domain-containing protein n=1 Tax=Sphingobacterium populi TaxID=1812824 RepID=A0ABW5UFT7_9SPHI|nr:DGQHR domain-containing protein [Sphingobacterium sp. CFCC 11742]